MKGVYTLFLITLCMHQSTSTNPQANFIQAIKSDDFDTANALLSDPTQNIQINSEATVLKNTVFAPLMGDTITGTPLMIATEYGNENIVRLLLQHNAEINHVTGSKKTALEIALEKENSNLAKLLLEHGANVQIINNASRIISQLKDIELKKLIIKYQRFKREKLRELDQTLFGNTVKHAYDEFLKNNNDLLAAMLGVTNEGIPPFTVEKAKSFFEPSYLKDIVLPQLKKATKKA